MPAVLPSAELALQIIVVPRAALADQINAEHELAQQAAETAVQHAARCGALLLSVKASLKHGEFMPWITQNCRFQQSTATWYMKAARQIATGVAISSVRGIFPSGNSNSHHAPDTGESDWYTPDEAALLAKARTAGGVETMEERRILTNIQRRLIQIASENLGAAIAAGVSQLSPVELRHALECCAECAQMCAAMLDRNRPTDGDLLVMLYAREISEMLKPQMVVIHRAMEAAP